MGKDPTHHTDITEVNGKLSHDVKDKSDLPSWAEFLQSSTFHGLRYLVAKTATGTKLQLRG